MTPIAAVMILGGTYRVVDLLRSATFKIDYGIPHSPLSPSFFPSFAPSLPSEIPPLSHIHLL